MYLKICPECKSKSYSAFKKGKWSCPECGYDLSQIEVKRPENSDQNNK